MEQKIFEKDYFIEACLKALNESNWQAAIEEIVERAVAHPYQLEAALGPNTQGGIQTLYRSSQLTILHFVWAPNMVLYPHDHQMSSTVGIYGGQEDNIFYRRRQHDPGIEQVGMRSLREGDVITLGDQAIHGVANPLRRLTGAIHVYGGDFFGTPRSEWCSEHGPEQPFDFERVKRVFEEANKRHGSFSENG